MAGLKKGTKLTDNPKDYMLRVRMDEGTLGMLDAICAATGESRSEVVRQGIKLSSTDAVVCNAEKYPLDTVMECAAAQMQEATYMMARALRGMADVLPQVDEDERHERTQRLAEDIKAAGDARDSAWAAFDKVAYPGAGNNTDK